MQLSELLTRDPDMLARLSLRLLHELEPLVNFVESPLEHLENPLDFSGVVEEGAEFLVFHGCQFLLFDCAWQKRYFKAKIDEGLALNF